MSPVIFLSAQYPKRYRKSSHCGPFKAEHPKTAHYKSDGGGWGKNKTKIMQGRVTEKKILQRRSEGKTSCRVNCTDALTNCIHLRGNLEATL